MRKSTYVEDVLVAIKSVKARLAVATDREQHALAFSLMADLSALNICLNIETQKLLEELYKMDDAA